MLNILGTAEGKEGLDAAHALISRAYQVDCHGLYMSRGGPKGSCIQTGACCIKQTAA